MIELKLIERPVNEMVLSILLLSALMQNVFCENNSSSLSPGEEPPTLIGVVICALIGTFVLGVSVLLLCCSKEEELDAGISQPILANYERPA